ncbi:hypothetical protein [Methylobacterium platani]|uniref:Uncharacterized protein n=1 Tax=Methylobacterium platani TaxID=427683 RepID=A0A179RXU4_9HYPH|nr:hypothetical protein [Methylobacterium platani]OAS15301.1 hypothetical protein A5481_29685 [Methylobacterium platani]
MTLPDDPHQMPDHAPDDQGSTVPVDEETAPIVKPDALFALRGIARRARARARPPVPSADPIGDYLLAEDERTKTESTTPSPAPSTPA